jgi:hypothetical protein
MDNDDSSIPTSLRFGFLTQGRDLGYLIYNLRTLSRLTYSNWGADRLERIA